MPRGSFGVPEVGAELALRFGGALRGIWGSPGGGWGAVSFGVPKGGWVRSHGNFGGVLGSLEGFKGALRGEGKVGVPPGLGEPLGVLGSLT